MFVAIDIGGTKYSIHLFENESTNSLIKKEVFESDEIRNYKTALNTIDSHIKKLTSGGFVDAVGISMTGDVNPKEGLVIDSLFFPDWSNKQLAKDLNEKLKCKVIIENDAICAAVAEISNMTTGKNKNYTFIAIGTGVGGVKLVRYSNTIMIFPWDFGHMIVEKDGILCDCGQKGCLEVYASGSGIEKRYGKSLKDLTGNAEIWNEIVDYMAQGITVFMAVNPTEKFIFGGGVVFKRPGLVDQIESSVQEKASIYFNFPAFELARYQEEAQAFGVLNLMVGGERFVNMNHY